MNPPLQDWVRPRQLRAVTKRILCPRPNRQLAISPFRDGSARPNPGPAGAGAVVCDEAGIVLAEVSEPLGMSTSNVAEY